MALAPLCFVEYTPCLFADSTKPGQAHLHRDCDQAVPQHLAGRFDRHAILLIASVTTFDLVAWRSAHIVTDSVTSGYLVIAILVVGALLAPGRRMVSSALRAIGLAQVPSFQTYHRVLNCTAWSSLDASRILLRLLVTAFAPTGPLVLGSDETTERRHCQKIAATGIYRDPVRSSHSHFVKVNGRRWVWLMLLVPIPWASRVWALPFLSALAASERYAQKRNRRPVVVGNRGYAALELPAAVRPVATFITRLRLDAHFCAPPPPRMPDQHGRPPVVGKRLPTLAHWRDDLATQWTSVAVPRWYSQSERIVELVSQTAVRYHTGLPLVPIRWVLIGDPQGKFATQALLCTDLDATPAQILSWFVLRWQMEVTFHAVRAHLGVETQRQWSERAIARTTPCWGSSRS